MPSLDLALYARTTRKCNPESKTAHKRTKGTPHAINYIVLINRWQLQHNSADYFTSPDNADEKDDDDNCMPSSAHSLEGTVMYEKIE